MNSPGPLTDCQVTRCTRPLTACHVTHCTALGHGTAHPFSKPRLLVSLGPSLGLPVIAVACGDDHTLALVGGAQQMLLATSSTIDAQFQPWFLECHGILERGEEYICQALLPGTEDGGEGGGGSGGGGGGGVVYSWGSGGSGRLGVGDEDNRMEPTLVVALCERWGQARLSPRHTAHVLPSFIDK